MLQRIYIVFALTSLCSREFFAVNRALTVKSIAVYSVLSVSNNTGMLDMTHTISHM